MEKISGIYCIQNKINGKRYIGKSVNIYKRWTDERSTLKRNKFHNAHLQNAWNKYGADAFKWSIIDICKESDLMQKEIEWIEYYKAYTSGYNQTIGGEGSTGAVCSEEKRKKLIESHSGDRDYRKHVYCIELKQEFWGAKEAERQLSQYGVRGSGVSMCCRKQSVYAGRLYDGTRLHWCYMEDLDDFKIPINHRDTPVYCIELDCFYENLITAQNDYRIFKAYSKNIQKCCNNDPQHHTCGCLSDGTKLTWRYATTEEINKHFVIL